MVLYCHAYTHRPAETCTASGPNRRQAPGKPFKETRRNQINSAVWESELPPRIPADFHITTIHFPSGGVVPVAASHSLIPSKLPPSLFISPKGTICAIALAVSRLLRRQFPLLCLLIALQCVVTRWGWTVCVYPECMCFECLLVGWDQVTTIIRQ